MIFSFRLEHFSFFIILFQVIYVKNELPVRLVEIQLAKAIRKNSICIIAGETGSGKSTQIPQVGFCSKF